MPRRTTAPLGYRDGTLGRSPCREPSRSSCSPGRRGLWARSLKFVVARAGRVIARVLDHGAGIGVVERQRPEGRCRARRPRHHRGGCREEKGEEAERDLSRHGGFPVASVQKRRRDRRGDMIRGRVVRKTLRFDPNMRSETGKGGAPANLGQRVRSLADDAGALSVVEGAHCAGIDSTATPAFGRQDVELGDVLGKSTSDRPQEAVSTGLTKV
jgi:hypothetical protein